MQKKIYVGSSNDRNVHQQRLRWLAGPRFLFGCPVSFLRQTDYEIKVLSRQFHRW